MADRRPPWGPMGPGPGLVPPMQQGQPMRPGGPGPPGPQWMPQAPPQVGGPGGGPPPGQPWGRMPPQGPPQPGFPGGQGPPHPGYPPQRPLFPAGAAHPAGPARPEMYQPPPQQGFLGTPRPGGLPQQPHLLPPQQQQQPARPFGGPQLAGQGQGQQLPGTPATPGGAPAASPQPPKSAWTEHTAPDGRKYYYNASTKTSSWTKPAELAAQQAGGGAAAEKKAEPQSDWKEFTAPDGRKYYYNRVTKQSKWQMPDELKAAQGKLTPKAATPVQVVKLEQHSPAAAAASAAAAAAPASNGVLSGQPSERKPEAGLPEPKRPVVYATKEEAKEAFKELLASVGTASNATWDTTMRLIANDPRYEAFRTIGEKKACFHEFLQQRAREEREEQRAKAKAVRDDFAQLLELSPELKGGTRYSKAAALFEDEPRWQAVKDAREREQLFNEHMRERERKEKEARRAEAKKRKAAFRSLLEATKSIKVDSAWRKALTKLEGEEEYEALDKLDRLEVFQAHIKELEKREREARQAERAARRRRERQARDAFRALLAAHAADGTITPKMRWKDYASLVEGQEAFTAVTGNRTGSRPRELFEDALETIEEAYVRSAKRLREAGECAVQPEASFEAFSAAVDAAGERDPELAAIPAPHRQLFFEEEQGLARERAAKEAKRRRRAREDFALLLRNTRRLKHDTSWADAQPLLEQEPEYRDLDPGEREELFREFVEKLAAKRREREGEREREQEGTPRKEGKEGKEGKKRRSEEARGGKERKEKRHKKEKGKDRDRERREEGSAERAEKRRAGEPEEERKERKRRRKDRERSAGGSAGGGGGGGDDSGAEEGEL